MVGSALARRVSWSLVDQAISSLGNFVATFMVARYSTASQFGAFGLALAVYLFALGLARAIASTPLVIRFSHTAAADTRTAGADAAAISAGIAVLVSLALTGIGTVVEAPLSTFFFAFALSLPGLLVQDAWRFVMLAEGRPRGAVLVDGIWIVTQGALLALLWATGSLRPLPIFATWAVGAYVAALAGFLLLHVHPLRRSALRTLRAQRDLSIPLAAEFVVTEIGSLVTVSGLAYVASLRAVAGIRGALTILGPLRLLIIGANLSAVPEGARLAQRSARDLVRPARVMATVLAGVGLLGGALLWLLPGRIGEALLGASWEPTRDVLIPMSVVIAARGASSGPVSGLRALGAARRSLRVQAVVAPVAAIAGLGGAVLADAPGAAVGLALGGCLAAVLWWRGFMRAVAAAGPEVHVAPPSDPILDPTQ